MRDHRPTTSAVSAAGLAALLLAAVPAGRASAGGAARPAKLALPADGALYHGVYPGGVSGDEDDLAPEDLARYEKTVGRRAAWVYFSNNWFRSREFPADTARWIRDSGSVPFIRLMLRSSTEKGARETVFTLENILAGRFDGDLRRWFDRARDFGGPLLVEWGTEVNGEWFPWNARWNGPDGARRFVQVFRRLVRLSREEGADNVSWVFHADAHDSPKAAWNRLENYYPGDAYVDWIAVSAYGPQSPREDEGESLRSMLDAVYPRLAALSPDKPILLAEFGCARGSPAASQAEWAGEALRDVLSRRWPRIRGFSWWNERWQNDDVAAHDTTMRVQDSADLAGAFRAAFARAGAAVAERPASAAPEPAAAPAASGRAERLRGARTWMYQLQGLDEEGAIAALAATEYPLLVLEPGHNLKEGAYDTGAMLRALRTTPSGRRRLLLAYVDIGQAEEYRDYWGPGWKAPTRERPGEPDFLVTTDPDGWSGNYPVAYWRKPWRELWLGQRGVVSTLARLGFDGAYLDWVEAYDDDDVAAAAAREGVDAPKAMIDFVADIRAAGRAAAPDFLVVVQNAPDLIDADPGRYARAIDALAVEDTWYRGAADADWDDPSGGDLRRRRAGERSTPSRLAQYRKYVDRGLPVFSVDYCIRRENARKVYAAARRAGLRPLVTRAALSRLTETPPDAP